MGFQEDPIPRTVEWRDGAVRLIDQRELPGRLGFLDCRTVDELCDAISSLAVRGAPALGAAGGYGVALACRPATAAGGGPAEAVVKAAAEAAERLIATRPTAVNLAWGARRVLAAAEAAAGSGAAGEDVGRRRSRRPSASPSRTSPTTGLSAVTAPGSSPTGPGC